jgi:hypothetical protein
MLFRINFISWNAEAEADSLPECLTLKSHKHAVIPSDPKGLNAFYDEIHRWLAEEYGYEAGDFGIDPDRAELDYVFCSSGAEYAAPHIAFERALLRSEKRKADALAKALRALASGNSNVEELSACTSMVSSELRLPMLLELVEHSCSDIFWACMSRTWSGCDDTWPHRARLLAAFQRHLGQRPPIDLPKIVRVFRGCSRSRIRNVAWTTDRAVALRFARGHRNIRVLEPVIASAEISREHVFLRIDDRNESEVLIDPQHLQKLSSTSVPTCFEVGWPPPLSRC